MNVIWARSAAILISLVVVSAGVYLAFGPVAALALACAALFGLLCFYLYQINRLWKVLDAPVYGEIPSAVGLWGEVYYRLHRLVKRWRTQVLQVEQWLASATSAVFDLTAVPYVSSAGFRLLLLVFRTLASRGGQLAIVGLSDEIIEGLEKIDQFANAVKEAEHALAAGRQELETTRRAVEESAATVRDGISLLEAELVEAEKSLPTDLKPDYQRVVRSKGADSLAVAEDCVCTGCGQQITLNMQNELKLSRLVFCKSCGRLLYLGE